MSRTVLNKNDARYRSTQTQIEKVFWELLKAEGFSKITIRQITERTGFNRGTFYLHAQDKYDLLEQIENNLYEAMMEGLNVIDLQSVQIGLQSPLSDLMQHSTRYVIRNKEQIMLLAQPDCDPLFFRKYMDKVRSRLFPEKSLLSVEQQYTLSLMESIVIGFLSEWINRDMRETPEEYAAIVMQLTAKTKLISILDVFSSPNVSSRE